MTKLDTEAIKQIIDQVQNNSDVRNYFRRAAIGYLQEVTKELSEKGVPDEILAVMVAQGITRLRGPSMTEIARQLIPIEPLPPGAIPFYDKGDQSND